MIEEADSIQRDQSIACDVCIIGAGAAGITIAAELSGIGLDIVLIESGGEVQERQTQALYRGKVTGAPQYPLDLSRLRFLGGTTNHWAGVCRPFDDFDFETRPWVPHSGWSIGKADLDPYYVRAHVVCDLGPYDYSESAWPGVAPAQLSDDPTLVLKLVQHSKPTRFGKKFETLLRHPDGPRVLLHANAFELIPNSSAKTIREVDVRTLTGNRFSVSARHYVLATGGIENARLLLLSNRVVAAGLGNERDLVGRYFMDHPGAIPSGVLLFFDSSYHRLGVQHVIDGIGVVAGLGLRAEVLERHAILNTAAYLQTPMTVEAVRNFEWRNMVQAPTRILDKSDMEMIRFLQNLVPGRADGMATICWIRSEQAPNPESRVSLGEDLDALGQRRVKLDWRLTALNRHTFVRAAELYAKAFSRSQIGRMKLLPWLLEDDTDWWEHVTPAWHHIGTTRMADNPARGVVDSDCRVFGLDNLYVAGSSVFPTSSYINPTLTLVALAIRLADHLKAIN